MSQHPEAPSSQRPLSEFPADAQRAAELLRTPGALMVMSADEADCVAAHMRLVNFPQGATLFREGDDTRLGYMLLVLDGDVSVATQVAGTGEGVPISVVGAGSILGEMALLDGAPRSATCTAITPVQAAGLSIKGLEMLLDRHPRTAAKLLMTLGSRTADRLRAMNEQLQLYAALADRLQADLTRLRGRA